MKRALVFGGSGQAGRAMAAALAGADWSVTATTREGRGLPASLAALGVRHAAEERNGLLRQGWDAVIDPLCFTAEDAGRLLAFRADIGTFCVISTASVYADDQGNGFESESFPAYPAMIRENQARVAPGAGYSAGKVAMEDRLLASGRPLILLRPGAIHGMGARHPREWVFAKRILDGRRVLPLTGAGRGFFHTTGADCMAGLTLHLLQTGQTGRLNVADKAALDVAGIAQAVAAAMGSAFEIVDATGMAEPVGHTPFSVPHPVRLSLDAALATGWDGGLPYAESLPPYLGWMIGQAADWRTAFPAFAGYRHDPFDYAAEDAALAALGQRP